MRSDRLHCEVRRDERTVHVRLSGELGLATVAVTIAGRRYRDLPVPLTEVGALLDAGAVHGGRKAYDHLLALAVGNGLPRRRVGEVLARTGLESVAGRRAGGFSLGMRQRLGIAAALLGD